MTVEWEALLAVVVVEPQATLAQKMGATEPEARCVYGPGNSEQRRT